MRALRCSLLPLQQELLLHLPGPPSSREAGSEPPSSQLCCSNPNLFQEAFRVSSLHFLGPPCTRLLFFSLPKKTRLGSLLPDIQVTSVHQGRDAEDCQGFCPAT